MNSQKGFGDIPFVIVFAIAFMSLKNLSVLGNVDRLLLSGMLIFAGGVIGYYVNRFTEQRGLF